MRALITGIAGFAGSHLAEYLSSEVSLAVAGIVHQGGKQRNLRHVPPKLKLYSGDVTDITSVERVLAEWRPDYVFHLAGQAVTSLGPSFDPDTLTLNVLGQYNVLAAIVRTVPEAVVLVVGSSEEYGNVKPGELPITEENPFRPVSAYAVSKIAQDMLGYQFFASHALRTVRVRPFNHFGPRQSTSFVAAAFASQLAAIEAGRQPPVVLVGNLDTRRDFCDVRDIVRAYWLAVTKGIAGEVYNLGSDRSYSIAEILDRLMYQVSVPIAVRQDPARSRPSDVPEVLCDSTKFRAQTGWRNEIPFQRTLSDLLDYHRELLRCEGA